MVMAANDVPEQFKRLKKNQFRISLVLVLLFIAVTGFIAQRSYQNTIEQAHKDAHQLVSDYRYWLMIQLDWLNTLTSAKQLSNSILSDPTYLTLLQNRPLILQIQVLDDTYKALVNYGPEVVSNPSNLLKAAPENSWQPANSFYDGVTEQWVVPMVRAWIEDDRTYYTIVLLSGSVFLNKYQQWFPDKNGSISLFSRDGIMLMRVPFADRLVGRDFSKGILFSKYLPNSDSGVDWAPTSTDGIRRLVAYREVNEFPLVVTLGFEIDYVLKPVEQEFITLTVGFLAILLLFLFFSFRLNRYIHQSLEIYQALAEAKNRLNYLAATDDLTGVMNRRELLSQLDLECQQIQKGEVECSALLMMDLDHFKKVNDQYGHEAGDQVLTHFTQRLANQLKTWDKVGRYGGEEFLIILHDIHTNRAYEVAERLRTVIERLPFQISEKQQLTVTVSIGMTMITQQNTDPRSLLAIADKALYKAKELGRNKVETLDNGTVI